jgi:coenzyme F420-reducing hydrogenase beta subunit
MIKLATLSLCTGCGACVYPCPKKCITMQEDTIGQIYPVIDDSRCIECHACERICPILSEPEGSSPVKAYASWSQSKENRRTSASGGVAHEIYNYALDRGYYIVGASTNPDFSVSLKVTDKQEDISDFKNSKYVFSSGYSAFREIGIHLKQGHHVVATGVSCQIAAMRKMYRNQQNIVFVEILCHGMTPHSYLQQHITTVERNIGKKASFVSFRDPAYKTQTFTFTLYDHDGNSLYTKRTEDGDSYQYGYHRGVSYRENCYHCCFAKEQRMGDIVLCDFYGLGKTIPCSYTHEKVSCVLICTEKGDKFFKDIVKERNLFMEERPVKEAQEGNPRLTHPTPKTEPRLKFEQNIQNSFGDFEVAIKPLVKRYIKLQNMPIIVRYFKAFINKITKFTFKKYFHNLYK